MVLGAALEIFEKAGYAWLFRWWHVVFGIAWIGLLYYFNFVQVPSFAQMDGTHRNGAIDKLVPRALWWFRFAALATFVTGLLLWGINAMDIKLYSNSSNNAILTGMAMGTLMAANVWMVIWPNQRQVIENARGVLAGKPADPNAATAGRKAMLASRTNTLLSVTMLMFMTGAGNLFGSAQYTEKVGRYVIYWIIVAAILVVIELNALGMVGGLQGQFTKLLEDHKKVIIGAVGLSVLFYVVLWEIVLRA